MLAKNKEKNSLILIILWNKSMWIKKQKSIKDQEVKLIIEKNIKNKNKI